MEVRRTVPVTLDVNSDDAALLEQTVDTFLWSAQYVTDHAFAGEYVTTSKTTLDEETYDEVREATDGFNGGLVQAARNKAADACKSVVAQWKQGKKASKPRFTSRSMTFDRRTLTVFPEQEKITLTTLGDHSRVHADLNLPKNSDGYQYKYLNNDDWEYTESTLHYRDGEWYIHLGYRTPKENIETNTGNGSDADTDESMTENGTVLGVDFGVNQIAATSTARFFDAGELNHTRREFERTRGELQRTGTQSAHRTLQNASGREERYVKHVLHTVANGIVEEALKHDCNGIILEELTNIREHCEFAKWQSVWAFRKLKDFVTYKAEYEGLFVDTVNPRNTSNRCNECGFVHDDNRDGELFECVKCGKRNHADYNAAKNIAELYLSRGHQPPCERSVSQYALKSGPLTPM